MASIVHHWPSTPIPYSDPENHYVESFFKEIGTLCDKGANASLLPYELIGLTLYKTGLQNLFKLIENKQFSAEIFQSALEFMVIDHSLQFTTFQVNLESVLNLPLFKNVFVDFSLL